MVLLDKLASSGKHELIVAHFDHGIRPDSADDARFVGELAEKYNLPFETKREELGLGASEETARDRRYKFLRSLAAKYQATIATAHHADDIVETVAINLIRGTGWRGLAVLDSTDIYRPLLHMTKQDIKQYAQERQLIWHEDSTNQDMTYLRNRVRQKIDGLNSDIKWQIIALRDTQCQLKYSIDREAASIIGQKDSYDRYFFIQVDYTSALEILRHITKGRLTRPQLMRSLMAIKLSESKKVYQAGGGLEFYFTTRYFTIKLIK